MKLRNDPRELEVLGDGTQTKSYMHVDDCVDAFLIVLGDRFWAEAVDVYNIGSEDRVNVLTIARIVAEIMGLDKVVLRTTHSAGGSAWPSDVKTMQLEISKIKRRGWRPKRKSEEAIRLATEQLIQELRIK